MRFVFTAARRPLYNRRFCGQPCSVPHWPGVFFMEETEQHWLYALSAPMVALNANSDPSYTSASFYTRPTNVGLDQSWGLHNRQELLEMVRRMTGYGHAGELEPAYRQWARCLPSEWQALLDTLSPRDRTCYEYASRTYGECGPGGIQAWDLGRMGFVLRCSVLKGWLDEQDSLWLHSRLAVRARYYYDSWNQYVAAFLVGRAYWKCLSNSDENLGHALDRQGSFADNLGITHELFREARSLFAELPWGMPLTFPERPPSLQEFDWS